MSIFSFVRDGGRQQQKQLTSARRRTAAATRRRSLNLACTEVLESRRFLSATLVSTNFPNTTAANGSSDQLFGPFISSNGRYVAFESTATDISPNGTATQQVYRRDRLTGQSQLVSLDLANLPAGGTAWVADMSPDGRYVLFFTDADLATSNVDGQRVSSDTNGEIDLYIRDMTLGETFLVSGQNVPGTTTTTGGTTPARFVAAGVYNDGAVPLLPAYISDDGRFISYASEADDLPDQSDETTNPPAASDSNGSVDLFVRDRQMNLTLLVTEAQGNDSFTATGSIDSFDMSADGGTIVLSTTYPLDSGDANGNSDVYVRKVLTGDTTQASTITTAIENVSTSNVAISADGEVISFLHIFTLGTHVDQWTSANGKGGSQAIAGNGAFGTPALSADGRFIFFRTTQLNLIAEPTSGANVFRYDRQTQITEVASLGSVGASTTLVGNATAGRLSVTPDGRYVAWQSDGTGADPAITNYGASGQTNVYVRDMTAIHAVLVNVQASDPTLAAAGNAWQPALSTDGKVVLFVSDAPNLTTNDSNGAPDIFYADVPSVVSPTLSAILSAPDITQGGATSYTFQVTYTGALPIVITTIDNNDIIVTGPGGVVRQAELVSINSATNATAVTATYRIVPPGGAWDVADNGAYTIHLNNRQVSDIQGNQFLAQDLGTFQVNLTIDTNVGPTFNTTVSESAGTFTLRIQRNPADIGGITASVNYAVLSGTATYGVDFKLHDPTLLQSGTLPVTLPPGGFYDLVFDIISDTMVESNETFQVVLSNITFGATTTFQRAIVTINDDDTPGSGNVGVTPSSPIQPVPGTPGTTISIENGLPVITTPETIVSSYGAGILPITISRADTGTASVPVTFNYTIYATPSDTATSENFVMASGTLSFAAGEVTKDLLVQILHDHKVTGDRDFTVVLTNATTGLVVGGTSIQVVVKDVDSSVQFSDSSLTVTDDAGIIDVPVSRFGNITPGSKVRLTFGGTAIAGQDYTVVGDGVVDEFGDITFAPGETSRVVHLQILSRPFNPGTFRTINLGLDNARALATSDPFSYETILGDPSAESVRINNVDAIGPQISAVDFKVKNGRIANITLAFNEDLAGAGAKKVANYTLFARTRDGKLGQLIRLNSAKYDPSTDTVTLTPASPLALNQIYQINVSGTGSITDVAGNRFDGDRNGKSGGNFSGIFGYGRTLSYADRDNDLVSFSLKGPGNVKITSLNNAVTVDVLNPDFENTTLLGTVTKRKGSNGQAAAGTLRLRGATFDADENKFGNWDIRADV